MRMLRRPGNRSSRMGANNSAGGGSLGGPVGASKSDCDQPEMQGWPLVLVARRGSGSTNPIASPRVPLPLSAHRCLVGPDQESRERQRVQWIARSFERLATVRWSGREAASMRRRWRRRQCQFESDLVLHVCPRIFARMRDDHGLFVVRSGCRLLDASGLSSRARRHFRCASGMNTLNLGRLPNPKPCEPHARRLMAVS